MHLYLEWLWKIVVSFKIDLFLVKIFTNKYSYEYFTQILVQYKWKLYLMIIFFNLHFQNVHDCGANKLHSDFGRSSNIVTNSGCFSWWKWFIIFGRTSLIFARGYSDWNTLSACPKCTHQLVSDQVSEGFWKCVPGEIILILKCSWIKTMECKANCTILLKPLHLHLQISCAA